MIITSYVLYYFTLSILASPVIAETPDIFVLQNKYMQIAISKQEGVITEIKLRAKSILDSKCSIHFAGQPTNANHATSLTVRSTSNNESASVEFATAYDSVVVYQRYEIDTLILLWDVSVEYTKQNRNEGVIEYILPVIKNSEKVFHYGHGKAYSSSDINHKRLVYREDLYVPMVSAYSPSKDYGLSILAPFELPKPKLQFDIDNYACTVSYGYLDPRIRNTIHAAIYLIPHGGDWRPALDFIVKKYPSYFCPPNPVESLYGWFYLAYPNVQENEIPQLRSHGVQWAEFTEYFPFYGLYVPSLPNWGIIIHSDEISLDQWEKGAGANRNDFQKMKDFIAQWHQYGIQVFLYFQSAEAWHPYARKHFKQDIATDRNGAPLASYPGTHLMNPDPKRAWGQYMIDQAGKILNTFPDIDGIFYDRMDYKDYDFGHDDGRTMIKDRSAYALALGQEKINDVLLELFHSKGKAVWGNVPTSVEVCKGLDGIMAEKNLNYLIKLQYLGLIRPVVYLPYDGVPYATENKMKDALLHGATISVTYGGKPEKTLEARYRPIFELLKERSWVLNASCLILPESTLGNIYRTPDSNYVVTVISPEKFQVRNHPFEYNIPIVVNVPDAGQIKYVYLFSGDWLGINAIEMEKEATSIRLCLPYHLATSAIFLARRKMTEVVRTSSPILIAGNPNEIVFHVDDNYLQCKSELRTPWLTQRKVITSNIVRYSLDVPRDTVREIEIVFSVEGNEHYFTSRVEEPISIAPQEEIFIHNRDGESVPFYISNNLSKAITLKLSGILTKGSGSISIPRDLYLTPNETKLVHMHIISKSMNEASFTAPLGNAKGVWNFRVNTCRAFGNDGSFSDDFKNGLARWRVSSGTWEFLMNSAHASGPKHFAYIDTRWKDYVFEATVMCEGSDTPGVDWLKSYVFFRVQNELNYYRFGLQGESGVLSLYRRIDGKWRQLRTAPFIAKKGKWYTLRVEVNGHRITCFVDNQKYISLEDDTFTSGGIGIGVLEDAQVCYYKNIYVKTINN